MQPSITRRTFVQFFALPALAFLRPRALLIDPPLRAGLIYSDDQGTVDFAALADGDPTTGIEYI
jgi:hypothetical protein